MKPSTRCLVSVSLIVMGFSLLLVGCSQESSVAPGTGATAEMRSNLDEVDEYSAVLPDPTFVETFDRNSNEGNWSFFGNPDNRIEMIEKKDGNPGAFLHARCQFPFGCLDTFAPQLRTQLFTSSIFTGDYRAAGVTHIGVDLAVYGPEHVTTEGRPLSLILRNDNDTPDDLSDDIRIYYIGNKMIPQSNGQFKSYCFEIPSYSTVMPKGWNVFYGSGSGDDDTDWNKVMSNVTQFTFFYGNPEMFFIYQQWELGVDNIWIALEN